jgi:chromate transporter
MSDRATPPPPVGLARLAAYFLRLGATGFGGPAALASAIRRDLVEKRAWVGEGEYAMGLALAAACPGPLAYQLAVYCGYVRHGVGGALAVAAAFPLAPFLIVVVLASAYGRFAGAGPLRGVFYGVAPVVVALIVKACCSLGGKTLGRDLRAWTVALVASLTTVVLEREPTALILLGGALGAVAPAQTTSPPGVPEPRPRSGPPATALAVLLPALGSGTVLQVFLFFFKTGCLVFGSGLVVVPFLKTAVVDAYRWLDERQFLDAVAVGIVSPGPVVITATFVGHLVAGFPGAVAATVGMFAPAVLFTLIAAPLLGRYARSRRLWGFVRGVTAAVVGVLAGTTVLLARTAVVDAVSAAVAALATLAVWRRAPEPMVVAAGALVGLITRGGGAPP